MLYQLYSASLKLSAFVDCYWESNFSGVQVYEELFVAQLNPHIIINLSDTYQRNENTICQSSLDTINTSAIKFTHLSRNQLFGIRFKPAGLTMFTHLGMHELVDSSLSLRDVFGSDSDWYETSMLESTTIQQRIAITERFLWAKIDERNLEKYRFNAAVQERIGNYICQPNFMAEVVESLNTTHRTLDRNFKQFLGLSPKKLHRLIRFQAVFEAVHNTHLKKQVFDFYDFGYYDQAHFGKEFKEFVGMTLQEYLNSPHFVQNLQDNHFS